MFLCKCVLIVLVREQFSTGCHLSFPFWNWVKYKEKHVQKMNEVIQTCSEKRFLRLLGY